MDKKMIAALMACLAGFGVFLWLALRVVRGDTPGNAAIADGKRVEYAEPSEERETASAAPARELPDSDVEFVRVTDYVPSIRVNLRYAGRGNFTGKPIYTFRDAYLRCGTVRKLLKAQEKLEEYGMGLMIWDAFRPVEAQRQLWAVNPNPLYVTDPDSGYSDHARGSAVDVTLVDLDGTEMVMPTDFDNFTKLADRDYSDVADEFAVDNAKLLEKVMKACGFRGGKEEWWHYSDEDSYDVDGNFVPEY